MGLDFARSSQGWLEQQNPIALKLAREILERREALLRNPYGDIQGRAHHGGFTQGMELALSYLSDRPGDLSSTGVSGFLITVASADEYVAKG